jgi:hypothetical protein
VVSSARRSFSSRSSELIAGTPAALKKGALVAGKEMADNQVKGTVIVISGALDMGKELGCSLIRTIGDMGKAAVAHNRTSAVQSPAPEATPPKAVGPGWPQHCVQTPITVQTPVVTRTPASVQTPMVVQAAKIVPAAAVVAPAKQKKKRETDIERNIREMESGSFAKHIQVVASKFISPSEPKGFGHSEIEELSTTRNTQVSQDIRKNMQDTSMFQLETERSLKKNSRGGQGTARNAQLLLAPVPLHAVEVLEKNTLCLQQGQSGRGSPPHYQQIDSTSSPTNNTTFDLISQVVRIIFFIDKFLSVIDR